MGSFTIRSGKISDTYFDKYQFESNPQLLKDIVLAIVPLIPAGTEVLAGLEMGGIPVVTMLSQVTGLAAAFIRKEPKEYGTCQYAEGATLFGRPFVLVEDVVSSGGAIIDAVAKLKADGLSPSAALCVIDRETGGKEALAAIGLRLDADLGNPQIQQDGICISAKQVTGAYKAISKPLQRHFFEHFSIKYALGPGIHCPERY